MNHTNNLVTKTIPCDNDVPMVTNMPIAPTNGHSPINYQHVTEFEIKVAEEPNDSQIDKCSIKANFGCPEKTTKVFKDSIYGYVHEHFTGTEYHYKMIKYQGTARQFDALQESSLRKDIVDGSKKSQKETYNKLPDSSTYKQVELEMSKQMHEQFEKSKKNHELSHSTFIDLSFANVNHVCPTLPGYTIKNHFIFEKLCEMSEAQKWNLENKCYDLISNERFDQLCKIGVIEKIC